MQVRCQLGGADTSTCATGDERLPVHGSLQRQLSNLVTSRRRKSLNFVLEISGSHQDSPLVIAGEKFSSSSVHQHLLSHLELEGHRHPPPHLEGHYQLAAGALRLRSVEAASPTKFCI